MLSDIKKIIQKSPLNAATSAAKPATRLLALQKAVCHSRAMSGDICSSVFARKKDVYWAFSLTFYSQQKL